MLNSDIWNCVQMSPIEKQYKLLFQINIFSTESQILSTKNNKFHGDLLLLLIMVIILNLFFISSPMNWWLSKQQYKINNFLDITFVSIVQWLEQKITKWGVFPKYLTLRKICDLSKYLVSSMKKDLKDIK